MCIKTPEELDDDERAQHLGAGRSFEEPSQVLRDAALAAYPQQTKNIGAKNVEDKFGLRLPLSEDDDRHYRFMSGDANVESTAVALLISKEMLTSRLTRSPSAPGAKAAGKKKTRPTQAQRRKAQQEKMQREIDERDAAISEARDVPASSADPQGTPRETELEQAQRLRAARQGRVNPKAASASGAGGGSIKRK